MDLSLPKFKNINGFEENIEQGNTLIKETLIEAKKRIIEALNMIGDQIEIILKDSRPSANLAIVPVKPVGFMEHNKSMISPRQDTFIDPRKAQIPESGKRLHVVETRKNNIESLYKLGLKSGKLSKESLEKHAKNLEDKIKEALIKSKDLEIKYKKVDEEILELEVEYEKNGKSILELNKTKPEKVKTYLENYFKEHEKEPAKSTLVKFEKGLNTEITKLKKRQETIKKQLEKLEKDSPIRKENIKEAMQQLDEEIKGYKFEQQEILQQILLK
jgi:chromosome segregation ATPase